MKREEEMRGEREEENLRETITDIEQTWAGDFLTMDRVTVTLPNGQEAGRDVLRHPGAVGILAMNEAGEILLEQQYRTAVDDIIWEIPAGKVDPDEDRLLAARRELMEETGFKAESLEPLGDVLLAAGYSDEILSLFLATGLSQGADSLDEDEFLEWGFADLNLVQDMVRKGKITDSKTLAALYYYELCQK